jgi:hypothetical protein
MSLAYQSILKRRLDVDNSAWPQLQDQPCCQRCTLPYAANSSDEPRKRGRPSKQPLAPLDNGISRAESSTSPPQPQPICDRTSFTEDKENELTPASGSKRSFNVKRLSAALCDRTKKVKLQPLVLDLEAVVSDFNRRHGEHLCLNAVDVTDLRDGQRYLLDLVDLSEDDFEVCSILDVSKIIKLFFSEIEQTETAKEKLRKTLAALSKTSAGGRDFYRELAAVEDNLPREHQGHLCCYPLLTLFDQSIFFRCWHSFRGEEATRQADAREDSDLANHGRLSAPCFQGRRADSVHARAPVKRASCVEGLFVLVVAIFGL